MNTKNLTMKAIKKENINKRKILKTAQEHLARDNLQIKNFHI